MRTQLTILGAVFTTLSLALVPSAPAAQSPFTTKWAQVSTEGKCRSAGDKVSFSLHFLVTKNLDKAAPTRVRVAFKVKDSETGARYAKSVVNMPPRMGKYEGTSKRITVPAGVSYYYHLDMMYSSEANGKLYTYKTKILDSSPAKGDQELQQLPACRTA